MTTAINIGLWAYEDANYECVIMMPLHCVNTAYTMKLTISQYITFVKFSLFLLSKLNRIRPIF